LFVFGSGMLAPIGRHAKWLPGRTIQAQIMGFYKVPKPAEDAAEPLWPEL
jgi:hypothetical protein